MYSVMKAKKTGDIYKLVAIDRKNQLVGGYRLFNGHCESNPFTIFNNDSVIIENLGIGDEPKEMSLS